MKSESVPEVSVVMAVYNEQKYIEIALESICSQEGVSMEIVVVDDHSNDRTWEILTRLAGRWSCIQLHSNPGKGKVAAFNYGVAKSSGRFVCLFAGDDVMPPKSLLERWRAVMRHSDERCVCSLSKIRIMSDDPRYNGHVIPRIKGRGSANGQSPLMNRRMVERLFPVPESLPNEDSWLDIAFAHLPDLEIKHTDIICCNWRMHAGNSYNLTMPHAQYKQCMERRWRAHDLFYAKFADAIDTEMRRHLERRIRCNQAYALGSVWGVIFSGTSLINRLRALGTINPFFYSLRRRFYGLLSGW